MKKVIIALLITAALIDIALCITIGLPYIIACIIADIIGTAVYKYGKNKAVVAWKSLDKYDIIVYNVNARGC